MEQNDLIEKRVLLVGNRSFDLEYSKLGRNVGSEIQIQRRF